MIIVDKVSKRYKSHKVLDNVSFSVKGGEFVSLIGPSGAGKSTLLHALIAAESMDSGHIKVDQYDVSRLNPSRKQEYRRRIGIVFQDYKLLPKKTVFENVAFALEVEGYDKAFTRKRTVEVLKLTGLEKHRNHFPRMLSGGEKQRTAIARALVHAPQLLFADEPTGNLDPENSEALAKLFLKINKHGTTVLISTHNRDLVNAANQRVIKLDAGKVVADKKASGYF
jgi:cell division transport system ATP-binding protein